MTTETAKTAPTQAPTEAPTQAPTQEPTQAPTAKPTEAPKVVARRPAEQDPQTFEAKVAKIKQQGSVAEQSLVQQLEDYLRVMAPGKSMSNEEGARRQFSFWNTLRSVIENSGREFTSLWNIVLMFHREHAKMGALGDRYVYRFAQAWSKSQAELTSFQNILFLISSTSDERTRALQLKQLNMRRILSYGINDTGTQNLLRFYQV